MGCVIDSFNRADSATLGSADTGEAWTLLWGPLGIESNRIASGVPLGENAAAYTDHGVTRVRFTAAVEHAVGTIRSGGGFLIRYKAADATFLLAHTLSDTAANPRLQIWTHAGLQRDEYAATGHTQLDCIADGDGVRLRWSGGPNPPDEISWATTLNLGETLHGPFTFRNSSSDPNVMDDYQACPAGGWLVGAVGIG